MARRHHQLTSPEAFLLRCNSGFQRSCFAAFTSDIESLRACTKSLWVQRGAMGLLGLDGISNDPGYDGVWGKAGPIHPVMTRKVE